MYIRLKDLKPNPYRNFSVDPIDPENVEKLKASIREDGFWGGIVCRELSDGSVQIAAGHHRVEAAIKSGIKEADVFVGDFDDPQMIRIYARENATQRGNTSTAAAGSVASALTYIAKGVLTGTSREFAGRSLDTLRGQIQSEKGLGADAVMTVLAGVPDITERNVRDQMANLKASGEYAKIIDAVQQEIEAENREAMKSAEKARIAAEKAEAESRAAEKARKEAAERAKKAREEAELKRAREAEARAEAEAKLAAKRAADAEKESAKFKPVRDTVAAAEKASVASGAQEKTFDFEGVAKHLKNEHQLATFRKLAQDALAYLPIENQGALAKKLVEYSKEKGRELSSAMIRDQFNTLLQEVKTVQRRLSAEQKRQIERADLQAKAHRLQREFSRNCHGMVSAGVALAALMQKFPKDLPFPITGEFRTAVKQSESVIVKLSKRI